MNLVFTNTGRSIKSHTGLILQATLDTEKGYIINISNEALQMSRNRRGGNNDREVNLIVSLLNETFFRVSGSSDIKVHRSTVCPLKPCVKCEFIFFGQHFSFINLWFLLRLICNCGVDRREMTQMNQTQYCMGKVCWEFGLVWKKFTICHSLFS